MTETSYAVFWQLDPKIHKSDSRYSIYEDAEKVAQERDIKRPNIKHWVADAACTSRQAALCKGDKVYLLYENQPGQPGRLIAVFSSKEAIQEYPEFQNYQWEQRGEELWVCWDENPDSSYYSIESAIVDRLWHSQIKNPQHRN